MKKQAIAIYEPSDLWEREVQESYHEFNDDWLPSFACQLAAKAILKLKTVGWVENDSLRKHRAKYFFSPAMTTYKEDMVLATYPLFLRDILENETVSSYLHDPIVFVTQPIAHYLLRDFPIHVVVKWQDIVADNPHVKFMDVGGLYLSANCNVILKRSSILSIRNVANEVRKVAATQVGKDVYEIDPHKRDLFPALEVWDKEKRIVGIIEEAGLGEKGIIRVVYRDGTKLDLPQEEFDFRFLLHTKTAARGNVYPIRLGDHVYKLNELQIAQLIKKKLLRSKTIRKMFDDFEVSSERLADLQIIITNLDQKYAETDLKQMKLDVSLFEDGEFFRYNFFVVAHEIVHWLSRVKEQDSYFNDPEEVLGFVSSIALELESNEPLPSIWSKIFPKISWHFHNEGDAKKFFSRMLEKAKALV